MSEAENQDEGRNGEDSDDGAEEEKATPEQIIEDFDIDKDCKISLEELINLAECDAADLTENYDGTSHEDVLAVGKEELEADKSKMAGFLAAADHDKKGFADAEEIPALLQAMDEADAKETAEGEHEVKEAVV